jgi:hypothetical protein
MSLWQIDGVVVGVEDFQESTGYWVLVTGYWLLGTGYWVLGAGYWVRVTGYWVRNP